MQVSKFTGELCRAQITLGSDYKVEILLDTHGIPSLFRVCRDPIVYAEPRRLIRTLTVENLDYKFTKAILISLQTGVARFSAAWAAMTEVLE
jgi:hypothetical protein